MSIPQLIKTNDGSHTLYNEKVGEYYHSTFGAIQESQHIFIAPGLDYAAGKMDQLNVLEIGFGTGLNALLALKWALEHQKVVRYVGIEAFPLDPSLINDLNYASLLGLPEDLLHQLHHPSHEVQIRDCFSFSLRYQLFEDVAFTDLHFDVVFFDAFSPDVQPEMWTEKGFERIYRSMKTGGVLTTYSCKGSVKRALKSVGFQIEKLAGPPGKREFIRAQKH